MENIKMIFQFNSNDVEFVISKKVLLSIEIIKTITKGGAK